MKIILIYLGPGCHPQKTYPKQTTKTGALNFMSSCRTDPMTASEGEAYHFRFQAFASGVWSTHRNGKTPGNRATWTNSLRSISRYLPWKQGISSSSSSSSSSAAAAAAALLQNRKMFAIFEASKPPGFGFSHIFFWFRSLGIDGFFPTGNLRRWTSNLSWREVFLPSKPRSAAPLATNWRLAELHRRRWKDPAPRFWHFPKPTCGSLRGKDGRFGISPKPGQLPCEAVVLYAFAMWSCISSSWRNVHFCFGVVGLLKHHIHWGFGKGIFFPISLGPPRCFGNQGPDFQSLGPQDGWRISPVRRFAPPGWRSLHF